MYGAIRAVSYRNIGMIAWLARGGGQRRAHLEFNHTYSAFPAFTFEMDESGRDILSIRESL